MSQNSAQNESCPPVRGKRKGISARLRFFILERDRFRCRYCGGEAQDVALIIDHIIPVVRGGTNDPENLVTACAKCNGGKHTRMLPAPVLTGEQMEATAEEHRKVSKLAEEACRAKWMREHLRDTIGDYWCNARDSEEMDYQTLNVMCAYAREHGTEKVLGWIDHAVAKFYHGASDRQIGRYISGMRKIEFKGGSFPERWSSK